MDWYWLLIAFIGFLLSIGLRLLCKHGCDVEPDYRRNQCVNISPPRVQAGFDIGNHRLPLRDEFSTLSSPLTGSTSLSDGISTSTTYTSGIPTLTTPYPPPISSIATSVYPPRQGHRSNPPDDLPPSYEVAISQQPPSNINIGDRLA